MGHGIGAAAGAPGSGAKFDFLPNRTTTKLYNQSMIMKWKGVIPAMTTAFAPDLSVDHAFVAKHAHQAP